MELLHGTKRSTRVRQAGARSSKGSWGQELIRVCILTTRLLNAKMRGQRSSGHVTQLILPVIHKKLRQENSQQKKGGRVAISVAINIGNMKGCFCHGNEMRFPWKQSERSRLPKE